MSWMSLFVHQVSCVLLAIVAASHVSAALARPPPTHCVAECDPHGTNTSEVQTQCLQAALDDCGPKPAVVTIPSGKYLTGSLEIPSDTTLSLAAGATLLASVNPADFPLIEALESYGMPRDCCCNDWLIYNCSNNGLGVPPSFTQRHRALLTTSPQAVNVAIVGAGAERSTIDGQGWPWWLRFESQGLQAGRPHLVEPLFVTNFRIEGLHLKDSPFWTLHPYACDHVIIRDLVITADPVRGHNTDGIDPDSCSDVVVERCYVAVGDDAVAIKSGSDWAGRHFHRPSQNMVFQDCVFASKHVSMGSEESGGIKNVTVRDSVLGSTQLFDAGGGGGYSPGVHLKAERGRGGYITDVNLVNLTLLGLGSVAQPIFISMFYFDARNKTNTTATPAFRNIHLQDLVFHNVSGGTVHNPEPQRWAQDGWAGALVGLKESPILNLSLSNVTLILDPRVKMNTSVQPWECSNVFVSDASRSSVNPPLPAACFSGATPSTSLDGLAGRT